MHELHSVPYTVLFFSYREKLGCFGRRDGYSASSRQVSVSLLFIYAQKSYTVSVRVLLTSIYFLFPNSSEPSVLFTRIVNVKIPSVI
jgi:hypothetical protein